MSETEPPGPMTPLAEALREPPARTVPVAVMEQIARLIRRDADCFRADGDDDEADGAEHYAGMITKACAAAPLRAAPRTYEDGVRDALDVAEDSGDFVWMMGGRQHDRLSALLSAPLVEPRKLTIGEQADAQGYWPHDVDPLSPTEPSPVERPTFDAMHNAKDNAVQQAQIWATEAKALHAQIVDLCEAVGIDPKPVLCGGYLDEARALSAPPVEMPAETITVDGLTVGAAWVRSALAGSPSVPVAKLREWVDGWGRPGDITQSMLDLCDEAEGTGES